MAGKKFRQSEVSEESTVGTDIVKDVGVERKKVLKESEETVSVMFRQNRKYELKLGRKIFIFEGREKKSIPKSLIDHKDFTPIIKKYFVIQEDEA